MKGHVLVIYWQGLRVAGDVIIIVQPLLARQRHATHFRQTYANNKNILLLAQF